MNIIDMKSGASFSMQIYTMDIVDFFNSIHTQFSDSVPAV